MWDHRNDILHNDGANFQKKMEGAEADVMIRTEFNTGKDTLLREDKFFAVVLPHHHEGRLAGKEEMVAGCDRSTEQHGWPNRMNPLPLMWNEGACTNG